MPPRAKLGKIRAACRRPQWRDEFHQPPALIDRDASRLRQFPRPPLGAIRSSIGANGVAPHGVSAQGRGTLKTFTMTGTRRGIVAALGLWLLGIPATTVAHADESPLDLVLTWGHHSPAARPFAVRVQGHELAVTASRLTEVEAGDSLTGGTARTTAGAGDVDGWRGTLQFAERPVTTITNAHSLWRYLWDHGDPEATRRLQADPAYRPDPRRIEITLDDEGRTGFSLTVDQLLRQRTFWFPELDLFLAAGKNPPSFAAHQATLRPRLGQRVLDQVRSGPEATYAYFTNRWEDMGSPAYANPHSIPPGQIIGLSWDGARHKFGVDRTAGVRNDYGKADEFRLAFDFGAATGLDAARTAQRLTAGLPVITTTFAKDDVECAVEQFVMPLDGAAVAPRGDLPMVLLQRLRFTPSRAEIPHLPLRLVLERGGEATVETMRTADGATAYALVDAAHRTLLWLEGKALPKPTLAPRDSTAPTNAPGHRHGLELPLPLAPGAPVEWVLKLPSPPVPGDPSRLGALDFDRSRREVLAYWETHLERGARFRVPEEAVNELFRANLWHAWRLPRRHDGPGESGALDLPYSNFAYDQVGIPWPVNQAVYVDYMLHDLRGYFDVAEAELAAMYRVNQEPNGHVGGFANWGVYTPGMLYAVAQHFLLSGDRASFERLLPPSLRALDWCLSEVQHTNGGPDRVPGLVNAPLNDLSHDPLPWAFNQAYFVAGFDAFGRALGRIGHPRAAECTTQAETLRAAVEREFARATVRSPAIELADGTWMPYVPCHALASGRQFTRWYPTDVDTGSLHLPRLRAIDPRGALTTYLLNDHEDNLLFRQWGAINEPVYNMQGTAYLLRDEPEAAIRTFYATMACAFSHGAREPVEHRWGWGQYFGPPSSDGAWFELFRNLLIREFETNSLLLGQATPRAWLEDGKTIDIRQAPTHFGPVDFHLASAANANRIHAAVTLGPSSWRPSTLLLRLRHPEKKPLRAVTVNGASWSDFNPAQEWVRIPNPEAAHYEVIASY